MPNLMSSLTNPTARIIWWLVLSVLLSACASNRPQAPTEDRNVLGQSPTQIIDGNQSDNNNENLSSSPLLSARELNIIQAQNYIELAKKQTNGSAINTTLSAAELFIQAEDSTRAAYALRDLDVIHLSMQQNYRYQIVKAYIDYSQGRFDEALSRVNAILNQANSSQHTSIALTQHVDALLLASFCHQKLGQTEPSLSTLVARERLLNGQARAETSRYIWQVIERIPVAHRQHLIGSTQDLLVRNRLEQSLAGRINSQTTIPGQFDRWRRESHQFQPNLTIIQNEWTAQSPSSIAVLLPESSRYQRAAQAVKDGIYYQHSLNKSGFQPHISFYDLGDQPQSSIDYFASAINADVDLVIGPLGKDYADSLSTALNSNFPVPTLLLGGENHIGSRAVRFDLSPENESQRIANYAFSKGYTNAVILMPIGNKGERAAKSFQTNWLNLGGKINNVVSYSPQQFDHSTELTLMFNLNRSNARHSALSNVLGHKPQFNPYRRKDIDFIYLIADNAAGRILRPQINFFGGQALPVISNSGIYTGIENQADNMDLNNTVFPSMPWQLIQQNASPYAGVLNQLFALGSDAYQLAAQLPQRRGNQTHTIRGNTGRLRIAQNGEVQILPIWTEFRQGLAVPISPSDLESLGFNPSARAETGDKPYTNRTRKYDDSNWNKRDSRRKSGS